MISRKKKFQKLEIHAQDLSCTNLVPRFKFQTFKCYLLLLVIVVCPLVEWMTMVLTVSIDFPCSQMSINKKGLLFSYNYLLLKWIQRVYRCDNLPWNFVQIPRIILTKKCQGLPFLQQRISWNSLCHNKYQ